MFLYPSQTKNYQKQEMQKYRNIYIHIPPPQRSLVQFFPNYQIQETPPPPFKIPKGPPKKHWGPGVHIFLHKNPPFASVTWNQDPIYVAGTFSFMMEASPDQATLLAETGWKPMVRNESDWRFFQMLRMCWTLSHVFFFGP